MPYIGRGTSDDAIRSRFVYVASGSETSISGADANGAVLKFTDGAYVDVYLNGVLLKPTTDYNTNTANTIAGLAALSASDEVLIVVYDTFNIANTVDSFDGGTFQGKVTFENKIDMNGTEIILDADADTSITADTDDRIDFRIGGTDTFHIAASKIGLGTTNAPGSNGGGLAVYDADYPRVYLRNSTTGDTAGNGAGIFMNSDDMYISNEDTDGQIIIRTEAAEKMRIDAAGNISLGNGANTNDGIIHINGGASAKNIVIESDRADDGQGLGNIQFHSAGTNVAQVSAERGSADDRGDLVLYGKHHNALFAGLRINSENAEGGRLIINGDTGTFRYSTYPSSYDPEGTTSAGIRAQENGLIQGNNGQWTFRWLSPQNAPYGLIQEWNGFSADNGNYNNQNWVFYHEDSDDVRFRVDAEGNVQSKTDSYGGTSDERLKTDIVDAKSQWDDIKALKIKNFVWKAKKENLGDDAPKMLGVIAQDLEASGMNGLVTKWDNPKTELKDERQVKYSILHMKAVKALQEAMIKIETLETSNSDLIKRVEALEAK